MEVAQQDRSSPLAWMRKRAAPAQVSLCALVALFQEMQQEFPLPWETVATGMARQGCSLMGQALPVARFQPQQMCFLTRFQLLAAEVIQELPAWLPIGRMGHVA